MAHELQPPSWRRRVHNRLCDLLARRTHDWHVLASHFERAERLDEAAVAYQHTAEWARRRGALEEARSHLTRAIELVVPLSGDATRDHREIELRLRRGFLAMSAEGRSERGRVRRTSIAAWSWPLPSPGDHVQHPDLGVGPRPVRAELDRARQVSRRCAPRSPTNATTSAQNRATGMLDWFAGRFESAVETLAAATADLAEIGRRRT